MRPPASLWDPVAVGGLTLRHRLVMAAMGTAFASPEGAATDRLIAYLARRAEGGIALVTTEAAAVDASGAPFPAVLRIDHDDQLEGLRRLTAAVHAHGVPISVQVYHAGRQMSRRVSGRQPVAPSAIPCPLVREMPRALGPDEILALVDRFGEAAARARAAGFDAVEVHGAHGYLIHQFLTPLANQRTDDWGGDLPGRARFALEVVRRVRQRVGPGFPILFKLSVEDGLPGGLATDDTLTVGRWLEAAGVDALIVSAGTYASFDWIVQPLTRPQACLRAYAARFRAALRIPVATVGRINDPALAEEIVASGDADLVQMGRALLADPDLPRKTRTGRLADVRPCVTCNECLARLMKAEPIGCAVNPEMGREGEPAPLPARSRHVVVVGGGVAGMQAAVVARERGHEVTLLEAQRDLGGWFSLADRPGYRREIGGMLAYLRRRLASAGVIVRLGTPVSAEDVKRLAPDCVVVATGARFALPAAEGASAPHVQTADQCLASRSPGPGGAVVLGSGRIACDVALHLSECGWEVTVLAAERDLARDVEAVTRTALVAELGRSGVRVVTGARGERIAEHQVSFRDANGHDGSVRAALVVAAAAVVTDDGLARALAAAGCPAQRVGNCAEPGGLGAAIHGATDVALRL